MSSPPRWVLGTAGHVDHGKSRLVEALTGIDPDRLSEEKEREMTIDLGFAWMTLPSGKVVSIVDVPGHEDFIKNMLAGVGGIDAVVLVVAADEGVMPQTREHLAIVDLLGVEKGTVALSKIDLAESPEWIELVQAEVQALLSGTALEEASIHRVSVRTGEGLGELIEGLDRLLDETPRRRDLGTPRLPIDRVFTLAGFGTVVTGTLLDGPLSTGQGVEIQPGGRRARIRGLHSHGEPVEEAPPGTRVAVNLTGIGTDELRRGYVLSLPGAHAPTRLLDARLRVLSDAAKPLGHNVEVQVSTGAARVTARTRILGAREIAPGEEGWAQLVLDRPVVVLPGDRFIVRLPSPSLTLGGGEVVDPHPRRRHPRFRPATTDRLRRLAEGEPAAVLEVRLRELGPVLEAELIRTSGLGKEAAEMALEGGIASGRIVVLDGNEGGRLLTTQENWESLGRRLSGVLESYHRRHPLREAVPREEVRSRLRMKSFVFDAVVRRAAAEEIVRAEGSGLLSPDHEVALSEDQESAVERLLARFRASPQAPPSLAQCEEAVGAEVVEVLLRRGRLIRVSPEVVFASDAYDQMVTRIVRRLQDDGPITVAQVRDLLGTSRRYAVALLEHLDERRITRRVGDERVLW